MTIVYNDWIINYNKAWRAFRAQVWQEEFGPILHMKTLPSSCTWIVPGTYED